MWRFKAATFSKVALHKEQLNGWLVGIGGVAVGVLPGVLAAIGFLELVGVFATADGILGVAANGLAAAIGGDLETVAAGDLESTAGDLETVGEDLETAAGDLAARGIVTGGFDTATGAAAGGGDGGTVTAVV